MGRRVHRVMAGVAAALAVITLTMIVIDSDSVSSSIVVPVPDSVEPSTSRLTPTEIATELSVTSPSVAATLQQPVRSTSTRQRSTATNTPPAQPPATNAPATQPPNGQAPARFDPSASFRIVNHVNSLALDSGGNVQPGTTMKFWESSSPSPNLQFQLIETGGGYYRLINRTNGLTVDGRGATTADSWVGQRSWNSAPSLQWMPVEVGNGLFTLTNRATGLLLDGAGRSTRVGSQAKQWPPTGSQNQLWRIVRV